MLHVHVWNPAVHLLLLKSSIHYANICLWHRLRCHDSNSQPLDHESRPITKRPVFRVQQRQQQQLWRRRHTSALKVFRFRIHFSGVSEAWWHVRTGEEGCCSCLQRTGDEKMMKNYFNFPQVFTYQRCLSIVCLMKFTLYATDLIF